MKHNISRILLLSFLLMGLFGCVNDPDPISSEAVNAELYRSVAGGAINGQTLYLSSIRAIDSAGRTDVFYEGEATVRLGDAGGTPLSSASERLVGDTTVNFVEGIASFSNLAISTDAGSGTYTLIYDTPFGSFTSAPIIIAEAADTFTAVTPPETASGSGFYLELLEGVAASPSLAGAGPSEVTVDFVGPSAASLDATITNGRLLTAGPALDTAGSYDIQIDGVSIGSVQVIEPEARSVAFSWIDIENGDNILRSEGNLVVGNNISTSLTASLGNAALNFFIGGDFYSAVQVSTNGFLVGADATANRIVDSRPENTDLPSSYNGGKVAALWDDLYIDGEDRGRNGFIYASLSGVVGERQLVVTWKNARHVFVEDGFATFQVILKEGATNPIVQFQDVTFGQTSLDNGLSATFGGQADSSSGRAFSFQSNSVISDNTAFELIF